MPSSTARLLVIFYILSLIISAGAIVYFINPVPYISAVHSSTNEHIVVYSSEQIELTEAAVSLFEEKTNISVEIVSDNSDNLLNRLYEEKVAPKADLIMGITLYEIRNNEQLFEHYVSSNEQYVFPSCQNKIDPGTAYMLRGNCIVINKTLCSDLSVTRYSDLLNTELFGKVAIPKVIHTSSGFMESISFNTEANKIYESLLEKGGVLSFAENIPSDVASGKYAAGLSYEDVCARLKREGADIELVYPNEGSVFVTQNAALVKNAPSVEAAKKFIDFLIGKDMQDTIGTLLVSRPVRVVAQTNRYLKRLDEIKTVFAD